MTISWRARGCEAADDALGHLDVNAPFFMRDWLILRRRTFKLVEMISMATSAAYIVKHVGISIDDINVVVNDPALG